MLGAMQVPQNEEVETQQELQPKRTELALEVNRTIKNLEELAQPVESQTTISRKPTEEITANASAWPTWLMGEQLEVVGT
jgi:hypothetical protein